MASQALIEQTWPADRVERWPIDRLTPYANNARTHTDHQIAQVAASIREWGWTTPVLVDEDGQLIAGHCRVSAAKTLGITEVPVMIATGWSDDQKRAYVLADNALALSAGWDEELLRSEIAALAAANYSLDLLGFDDRELAQLLAGGDGLTDPDEIPEAPADPVTVPGDVWVMDGSATHRLVCGDSTDPEVVARCLNGAVPHLMVTDPPYGVEYDANWRNGVMRANGTVVSARAIGKVLNDDRADWSDAWALFPGEVAYVWHAGNMAHIVAESLIKCGFDIRAQIVWAKNQLVIGRGHYHPQHEPCWYAVQKRQGATGHWQGDRKQTTLWEINKPHKSETGHSTQKPVECMQRPIENNSAAGDAVYEPFSGSFTTGIACERTARRCLGIELNAAYVDVGVLRWQSFAGKEATLEATGQTFTEVASERAG